MIKPSVAGVVMVAGLAIAARVGVLWTVAPAQPTTWESETLAVNLAMGRGFTYEHHGTVYRAFKPPLYEWLCAGVYRLFAFNQRAMIVVQCLWGVLLAIVSMLIGTRLFGHRVGWLAGGLVGLHPALVYYETHQLHGLPLAALLVGVFTLTLLWAGERGRWHRRFLVGAVIGLVLFERGTIGFLVPLSIVWLWWVRPLRQERWWSCAWPVVAGAALVIAPWMARNYAVYHRFVPMTSLVGELLWRGNNPQATGTNVTRELAPILDMGSPALQAQLTSLDEWGQQDLFRREAWQFIRSQPGEAARLVARKLYYFWWFAPTTGYRYPHAYFLVYRVWYAGILLFACYAMWVGLTGPRRRVRARLWALLLVMVGMGIAQSFFYVETRHRWVIEPLLVVVASFGMWRAWRAIGMIQARSAHG